MIRHCIGLLDRFGFRYKITNNYCQNIAFQKGSCMGHNNTLIVTFFVNKHIQQLIVLQVRLGKVKLLSTLKNRMGLQFGGLAYFCYV